MIDIICVKYYQNLIININIILIKCILKALIFNCFHLFRSKKTNFFLHGCILNMLSTFSLRASVPKCQIKQ